MTNQTIAPALTPQEAKDERIIIPSPVAMPGHFMLFEIDSRGLAISVSGSRDVALTHADCVRLAAIANHALPDGHPLKITREDVNELASIARDHQYPYGPSGRIDEGDILAKLAAKLAALLPPEDA